MTQKVQGLDEPKMIYETTDPKYGICNNELVNRATGVPVTAPAFTLLAKDVNALATLECYYRLLNPTTTHAAAVRARLIDFQRFSLENPELMKEADTAEAPWIETSPASAFEIGAARNRRSTDEPAVTDEPVDLEALVGLMQAANRVAQEHQALGHVLAKGYDRSGVDKSLALAKEIFESSLQAVQKQLDVPATTQAVIVGLASGVSVKIEEPLDTTGPWNNGVVISGSAFDTAPTSSGVFIKGNEPTHQATIVAGHNSTSPGTLILGNAITGSNLTGTVITGSAVPQPVDEWRALALKFDGQRMEFSGLLQLVEEYLMTVDDDKARLLSHDIHTALLTHPKAARTAQEVQAEQRP
jgi:hypothetical protein